jgi:hypothetical protein
LIVTEDFMAKTTWLAAGALLMIAFWPETGHAGYEQGVEDYQRGDDAAAFQEFLPAAQ